MPDPLADKVAAVLRRFGPLTAAEVAGRLGVPGAAVAAALDRLLNRHAVARVGRRMATNPAGRRYWASLWAPADD